METVTVTEDSFTYIAPNNKDETLDIVKKIIGNKVAIKMLSEALLNIKNDETV